MEYIWGVYQGVLLPHMRAVMSNNIHIQDISRTQGTNTPRGLCGIPDVQEDRTSVRNNSLTQDRNTASPPCEISVCKDGTSMKNISHNQDKN